MATQIQTWEIVDGRLKPVATTLAEQGRREGPDLETWIASDPTVLGPGLLIIGRQVQTSAGLLDLLAIDSTGNVVVVELKRERIARDALSQAIDYASDIASWNVERLSEQCLRFRGKSLEDSFAEQFEDVGLESVSVNENQRILLVGFGVDSALERMIEWLSDRYGVAINAIVLTYVRTASGAEVLAKTAIISEEVEQSRAQQKKLHIPMSDEPGTYSLDHLKLLLISYLSRDLYSARRIRDVLLPACLHLGRVNRDRLVQEFMTRDPSVDTASAGRFIALISLELGREKNDFLRQVIGYEYPVYPWAKDNYHVRDGYEDLVRGVLEELRNTSVP